MLWVYNNDKIIKIKYKSNKKLKYIFKTALKIVLKDYRSGKFKMWFGNSLKTLQTHRIQFFKKSADICKWLLKKQVHLDIIRDIFFSDITD